LDELAENFRLNPNRTSFGPVQIQIYRAAQELGYNPDRLSPAQRRALIWTLLDPQSDLFVVASRLRRLKDIDVPWKTGAQLTDEDVRLIGGRYNRGAELSRHALQDLGLRPSYGDDLVRRKQRSIDLLK
jgi:hypothetical protein